MRSFHRRFDRYYIGQIYVGDFAKKLWPSQNTWTLPVKRKKNLCHVQEPVCVHTFQGSTLGDCSESPLTLIS